MDASVLELNSEALTGAIRPEVTSPGALLLWSPHCVPSRPFLMPVPGAAPEITPVLLPAHQVDQRRQWVSQTVEEVQKVVYHLTTEISNQDIRFQAIPYSLMYNGNITVSGLPRLWAPTRGPREPQVTGADTSENANYGLLPRGLSFPHLHTRVSSHLPISS